jgi:DNA-binding beta-propeller fold protein YncE
LSHLLYITSRPQPALTASTGYVLRVSADDTHLIDITGKIPVGINPWGIGITGNQAYVANFGDSSPCRPTDGTRGVDGSVARIDLPGFTVAQTVTLAGIDPSTGKKQSSAPTFIGINPNTGRIYTPLSTAGQLAVLDGNLRLLTKIAADEGAFGVAVDPGTNRIYVSSRDARSISIIDGTSNKITGKIDLLAGTKTLPGMPPPNAPYALALDPGLGLFYVSIDPQPTYNGIDPCHAAEGWPRAVGNPRQVWIYQTSGNNRIDVLNVREGGDNGGTGIAVNPQNHHVFVTNCKDNTVSRFNGAESPPLNVTTITNPLFNCPSSVAVDSAFGRVFIGNRETTNPNPPPLNEAVIVLSDR